MADSTKAVEMVSPCRVTIAVVRNLGLSGEGLSERQLNDFAMNSIRLMLADVGSERCLPSSPDRFDTVDVAGGSRLLFLMSSRYLLATLLCGALSGCGVRTPAKSPVKVEVLRVELTEAAKTMTLTGEIRAQVESDLGFRTDGRITERLVGVGDHVSSGQILAKLDPQEQQATVDAAESDVRAEEAKLRNETSNLDRAETSAFSQNDSAIGV